jgi:hypothetical protein
MKNQLGVGAKVRVKTTDIEGTVVGAGGFIKPKPTPILNGSRRVRFIEKGEEVEKEFSVSELEEIE